MEFESVSKRFGEKEATQKVSLKVPGGSFTVIIGPSGCGKSTLLGLAAGLDEPSDGYVFVGGREVAGPTPEVALLFQHYNLFPWLTACDNVAFAFRNRGMSRREARQRAMNLLSNVGLGDYADKVPDELSGGMKQRVALVRAFALQPGLLLMDEPFAALDHQTRRIMQSYLLMTWQATDATVIMVTHDLDEALYLADQLVLFSGSPGTVSEVIDIDVARPRQLDEPRLAGIRKRLEAHLEKEVAYDEFTEAELIRVMGYTGS
ncbi:MAG: ABC transporter ATP-binding protein [Gammaproteobacteria bacterium]|nr:ABC transporter ATP-binding protein [Gammaproteobacteria bacterium]